MFKKAIVTTLAAISATLLIGCGTDDAPARDWSFGPMGVQSEPIDSISGKRSAFLRLVREYYPITSSAENQAVSTAISMCDDISAFGKQKARDLWASATADTGVDPDMVAAVWTSALAVYCPEEN